MKQEEYTALRFNRLKKHIYSGTYDIGSFFIREAHQVGENEYEYYDSQSVPLRKGDIYFTPDGTAFITASVTVPAGFEGRDYYLRIKTAAEMIVKVNGRYAGGIDPNRETVLVSPYAENGRLDIEIEAYNRSKPDDERNPEILSVRGCRQVFEGGSLVTVNNAVQSLVYDTLLLTDAAQCGLFGEDYSAFVNAELNKAYNLIDFDDIRNEDVEEASRYIEKNIYGSSTYKGSGRVALVGHSHLDLAYYWRRIHTVQKNLRTVLIQMRLMDKYPDFTYAHTQAYTYETLEKYYPEVFDELKEKIASGRFEVAGAMYVEPDCNIPSAESLIRQCLYGQHYFRQKFGITVDNAWLPDVFGNSWILPQILRKSGVKYFVSNKMSTWNDTNLFPHNNFIWRGIDGSEVYACVPPTHFISWNMPSQIKSNWDSFQDKDTGTETLQMFGYGDGGSGCTEEMIELMHRFGRLSVMPETRHTTGSEYLKDNFEGNKNLKTWDGELYLEMHRGTFTTKALLKAYNRHLEYLARDAELISVLRMKQGAAYPSEKIKNAYKKLMINQFHDILPGSHITPVYLDALRDYESAEKDLRGVIGEGGRYFNTLNFRRECVTFIPDVASPFIRKGIKGRFVMLDMAPLSCGDIPAPEKAEWFFFENGTAVTPFYKIDFAADGSILSLYDKELSRQWAGENFNKPEVFDDRPGNYDAWDILPDYSERPVEIRTCEKLSLINLDGQCAELCALIKTGGSFWCRIIRLFRSSRGIEVENIVNWQEKHKLAKVRFDCNLLTRELTCDTTAGFIKRETHRNTSWQQARFETCMHNWCDMSETGAGIALINENKYGVSAVDSSFSVSLLRAPIRPDPTSDMGIHDFCYMIYPHGGDFVSAGINRKALEYNIPPVKADVVSGLPDFAPLWLQSVKLSENGKMIVYRLSEQDGRRGTVNPGRPFKKLNMLEDIEGETDLIEYTPFEIITLGEEII